MHWTCTEFDRADEYFGYPLDQYLQAGSADERFGGMMSSEPKKTIASERRDIDLPRDQPAHPMMKANLLMAGVVLLLVIIAITSTVR